MVNVFEGQRAEFFDEDRSCRRWGASWTNVLMEVSGFRISWANRPP